MISDTNNSKALDKNDVSTSTLKAKDLLKKETDLKPIYEMIKNQNEYGAFKTFFPHDRYFSEKARLELMENGFKVYKGDWDGIMKDVYIIEW
jgi:hypothetical protein